MRECSYHRGAYAEQRPGVVFTPMHGVGGKWAERAWREFALPPLLRVEEQWQPDPEFPTVPFPNPEEGRGALALAFATADRHGVDLVLANDPDSDRCAAAEKCVTRMHPCARVRLASHHPVAGRQRAGGC